MAFYLVWAVLLLAASSKASTIGTPATITDFPGIVQVEVSLAGLFWTQQCAGSILTSFHILSTASCFNGTLEYRRVRAGSDIRGSGGVIVGLASANNHPDWDADICVVRVERQLVLGDTISQIPILGEGIELPVGLSVQLAGWGTTAEGGNVSSSQLFSLRLYVTNRDRCTLQYLEEEKNVTENHICFGLTYLSGRDYDARDSGDPFFYQDTLVGMLAYGKRDANDEYPLIATAVSSYTRWIIANAI